MQAVVLLLPLLLTRAMMDLPPSAILILAFLLAELARILQQQRKSSSVQPQPSLPRAGRARLWPLQQRMNVLADAEYIPWSPQWQACLQTGMINTEPARGRSSLTPWSPIQAANLLQAL